MKGNLSFEEIKTKINKRENIGEYIESAQEAIDLADKFKDVDVDFSPYYNQCITKVMLDYSINDLLSQPVELCKKLMETFREDIVYITLFMWRLKGLI